MASISIFVGSVYGGAQYTAEQVNETLASAGHTVSIIEEPSTADFSDADAQLLLVITSTTGVGDIPPNLEETFFQLRDQFPDLSSKRFGVIALGDTSYGDTYCAAGKQFYELLLELRAQPVADVFLIDACETMEPETAAVEWLDTWTSGL